MNLFWKHKKILTLTMLNPDIFCFVNSVDQDELALIHPVSTLV